MHKLEKWFIISGDSVRPSVRTYVTYVLQNTPIEEFNHFQAIALVSTWTWIIVRLKSCFVYYCQNRITPLMFILQDLLTSVSRQIHETAGRGRFDDVIVILPKAWLDTECVNGIDLSPPLAVTDPDFEVSGADPLFGGQQSRANVYGQCGTTSLKALKLPFPLLSSNLTTEAGKFWFYFFDPRGTGT